MTAKLTIILATLLAWNTTMWAQVSFATINGTVKDASGAVIAGADLLLRNVQTGVETRATTNEQGIYVLLNILPGPYTLEASRQGFSTARLSQFNLVVNQSSVFDMVLAVGAVQDAVTVEAVGAQVQSGTAELGTVLTSHQVVDMPYGRNIQNLMRLTPGVNPVGPGQSSVPSVNGQVKRSSMFMLDGVNNQSTFMSNLAVSPIVETLEEFKVQSHNDSAEFGGIMGGVMNTSTKSGTNEYHGNGWYQHDNDAFRARNTFQPTVNPYKGHIFGGTAGGPVWIPKLYKGTSRTFFYAGYEVNLNKSPAFAYLRVPTAANLRGDFSDWPKQIFNPSTTRVNPANPSTFIRDPFPGNQIPASMLNPGMVYYSQTVLPQPEPTNVADRNAINRAAVDNQTRNLSAKVDHKFTDKDAVWVRYTETFAPNKPAGALPSLKVNSDNIARNFGASWVHTFNPTSVLQLQGGRVKQWGRTLTRFGSLPSDFQSKVGYTTNIMTPYRDKLTYLPGFSVANYYSGGESLGYQQGADNWHIRGSLTKLWGRHTLKAGGDVNFIGYDYENYITTVNFADAQTANPSALGTTGGSLASMLLAIPDGATRRDIVETTAWWASVSGFFVQDSWKVTNNLTLNIGLRYDRTLIPPAGTDGANNNYAGNIDFNTGKYVIQRMARPCSETGSYPCIPTPAGAPAGWLPPNVELAKNGKIYRDTTRNFQPRFGLAYRVNQRTAIRASAGVYFDNYSGVLQISRNFIGTWPALGFQSVSNLNYPVSGATTPSVSAFNPLPSASLPPADPFTQSAYWADPNWRNAYSIQWNGGIQHQLTKSMLLTANYVGSGTHRANIGGRYNVAVTPGPGDWRQRAPFPYIAVPISWDRAWGNTNYHALQTSLERRFSNGLALSLAYTWSKAIDTGSSGFFGVEGQSIQNPYDMRADRSVSSFNVPHNAVIGWVYDLPFGRDRLLRTKNRILDTVIGGWQVNGIADLRSGNAVNVTVSGDIANTGNVGYMRPNVAGDWKLSNPTPSAWFNKAAFATPAQFTFGNAGRNILRGDRVQRFDISVFRNFRITERSHFEFRCEAYNVFNTVTYGDPTAEFTNVNFGKVLSAMASRSLRLGGKFVF
ncbi:MAG: TonB-dependent receptor [Acidobacteria bacterium]|nr:TonB-dependent receptor [Acidobacteriota bacterium]